MDSDIGEKSFLLQVKAAAAKQILFSAHAASQMNSPNRMISTQEAREVVLRGVVIEDYPENVRGHSCLMLGWGEGGRPLHVVCAPKPDYLPNPEQWEPDWRTRRKK